MNTQIPEKIVTEIPKGLDVTHIWKTIQGEGPWVGMPAIFIRLAGCNLQCPKCDTDYTSIRQPMSLHNILSLVAGLAGRKTRLVVLTGGEPFRQPITHLVQALMDNGYVVQLETNGTIFQESFPYDVVTTVCSPKTPQLNKYLEEHIDAYKYIIQAGQVHDDGLPTCTMGFGLPVARPLEGVPVYLQPLDESPDLAANQRNIQAAVESCMKHGYRLCLQTHKLLGLE